MSKLPKKRLVAIVTAALLLAGGGGVAFAYWTAGGAGTGSATTGTSTVALTAVQTGGPTNMRPGDTAQTLSGTFTNTNSGPVYVASVVASIASVFKAGVVAVGCDSTDFTLANATMTVAAEVPAGTAVGAWTGATIKFNDKTTTNQDACKGTTVNLAYAVN
ncbi:MAG: hypothetical protein ABJA94_07410 [Rhodoglobus sp.]